jgi:hypothetical protein
MDRNEKLLEIGRLETRIRQLETEIAREEALGDERPPKHYLAYYATTGFLLGIFGACTSLMLNVVGSLAWPYIRGGASQNPLRLIQVYLTFPMGKAALETEGGIALAIGCCLYIGTGMVYGMVYQVIFSRFFADKGLGGRLVVASVLSLAIWLINFYGILLWLQPLLFGGRWILDLVDWWVAAVTHLIFGWTMALVYPLGVYRPYRVVMEN